MNPISVFCFNSYFSEKQRIQQHIKQKEGTKYLTQIAKITKET